MSISFAGSMGGNLLATLYYLVYLLAGYFLVSRLFRETERPAFRLVMGAGMGTLLLHWSPVLFAFFVGFGVAAQLLALLIPAVLCALAWKFLPKEKNLWAKGAWSENGILICFCILTFLFYALTLWKNTIRPDAGAMMAGQCTYGDMNMHLGFITSLAGSDTFPIDYSIFPGNRLNYPFLGDSISSSLYVFGASLRYAYVFPMLVAFLEVMGGFYLLADTALQKATKSLFAWIMFFFCGGFGFFYFLGAPAMSGTEYTFSEIFTAFYHTPTNLVDENIRWVNVIVDMLIPQRATLFGWAMLFPTLTLLYRAAFLGKKKELPLAGVFAGALPMIHTHSFLAVGMVSAMWLLYTLLPKEAEEKMPKGKQKPKKETWDQPHLWGLIAPVGILFMSILWKINERHPFGEKTLILIYAIPFLAVLGFGVWMLLKSLKTDEGKENLKYWAIYLGLVLLFALPQLFTWTFRQTAESGMVHPGFNWVNSDSAPNNAYAWFYLKNLGIPAILAFLGLVFADRKKFFMASPALLIWATAEFFIFQPNFYDNNKLLYVGYALLCILAADFLYKLGKILLHSKEAKAALAAVVLFFVSFSGILSMGREYVSEYELYNKDQVDLCKFIENNTAPKAVILTDNRHNNAVPSLTGRSIVCGANSFLYFHGFDTSARQADVAKMYANPQESQDLFKNYNVDYVLVSEYERGTYSVNEEALSKLFPLVYEANGVKLYDAHEAGMEQ